MKLRTSALVLVLVLAVMPMGLANAQTELLARNMTIVGDRVCALTYENTIKCWGSDSGYMLGADTLSGMIIGPGAGDMGDNLLPLDLGTGLQVQQMCKAKTDYTNHMCAVFTNGRLKCWGNNIRGQLGLNDTAARGDSAGEMGDNLPFVELGYNADGSPLGVKYVACGYYVTCAILDNNLLKCWGSNNRGKLGLGLASSTENRGDAANEMGSLLPYVNLGTNQIVTSIELGHDFACATVKSVEDTYSLVKCWGSHTAGQLGTGTSVSTLGTATSHMGDNLLPVNLGIVTTVKSISCGHSHVCALLSNDKVKCWGSNAKGQLGGGVAVDFVGRSSDMGDSVPEVSLGSSFTPARLSMSPEASCAISTNNVAKCWGFCPLGLCNGADSDEYNIGFAEADMGDNLLPVPFAAGQYALEIEIQEMFACALLNTHQVKCWGSDTHQGYFGMAYIDVEGLSYYGGPVSNPYTIDLGTMAVAVAPSTSPSPTPTPSPTPSPTSAPTPEPTPAPTPESTGSLCEYFCTWSGMLLRLYSLPHLSLSLSLSPLFGFDLQVQQT